MAEAGGAARATRERSDGGEGSAGLVQGMKEDGNFCRRLLSLAFLDALNVVREKWERRSERRRWRRRAFFFYRIAIKKTSRVKSAIAVHRPPSAVAVRQLREQETADYEENVEGTMI